MRARKMLVSHEICIVHSIYLCCYKKMQNFNMRGILQRVPFSFSQRPSFLQSNKHNTRHLLDVT